MWYPSDREFRTPARLEGYPFLARKLRIARLSLRDAATGLRIVNLSVGAGSVDLLLTRHVYDVGVTVLR